MNISSMRDCLAAWLIALMCAVCFCVYGGDAKDATLLIETKSTPHLDKGDIALSITNKTDHSITVYPAIDPEFLSPNGPTSPTLKEADERDIIVPSIVFIAAPGNHIITWSNNSGGIGFVKIAPGETKIIKLVDDSLISMAKGASKVTFSLSLNGQDLATAKVVMTNLGNAWKVEN